MVSGIRRQSSHARAGHITDWRYKEEATRLLVGNSSEDARSDAFMALETPTAPVGRRFVASRPRKGHMALRHEPKARSAALDLD